jgi:predicted kinase
MPGRCGNAFVPVLYHDTDQTPLPGPCALTMNRATKRECEYRPVRPVLVVVGGLSATGKSTIARLLAEQAKTPYFRVDRIEQAVVAWSELSHPLGPAGYAVAYELAKEQLELGLDVIVECVNPIALTRDAWLKTAESARAVIVEVEVVCSDEGEHRRRVETRTSDVEGLMKPTWATVMEREYEQWSRKHLVVDSAKMSAEQAARLIGSKVASARAQLL